MTMRLWERLLVVLAAIGASPSCSDPVHSDEVAALGPEADGVRPGPLHRAGQPCMTCHGGSGPAGAVFAVAGTVFKTADAREGIADVQVSMSDSTATGSITK